MAFGIRVLLLFFSVCFLCKIFSGDRKHELNTVFLVYPCGAGIVVNGYNIGALVQSLNAVHHPLATNMIRQAAKGLGADNILVAGFRQLQHFGSQKPALAHFVAVANNALYQLFDVLIITGDLKLRLCLNGLGNNILHIGQIVKQELDNPVFGLTTAIELNVFQTVVDLKQNEIH